MLLLQAFLLIAVCSVGFNATLQNRLLGSFFPFGFVLLLCLGYALLKRKERSFHPDMSGLIVLGASLCCNLINTYYIHSYTISSLAFLMGVSAILGFFAFKHELPRIFWGTCILALLLPLKEYIQIFIGVPLRLFGARVIASFFSCFGTEAVTQSSVLVFEGTTAHIDYVCSGTSTLYVLALFICFLGFFKGYKLGSNFLFISIGCFFLAVFLNILRMTALVFLDEVANMPQLADKIHTLLGVMNFSVLGVVFLYFMRKESEPVENLKKTISGKYVFPIVVSVCAVFSLLSFTSVPLIARDDISFEIKQNPHYPNIDLSAEEKSFFAKNGASIEKYQTDKNIIILKITASSWKALHNPITCIKSQGFEIEKQETIKLGDYFIRHVIIKGGNVYYFFSDGQKITDDYYQKTFESFFARKSKTGTLVLISSKKTIPEYVILDELASVIK